MPFLDAVRSMRVSTADSVLCRTALPFWAWRSCSPKVSPRLFWFIYIRPKSWVWVWISSIYGASLLCVPQPGVCECTKALSRVRLCAAPWTITRQAPPSMEFSRQGYWSGLPFPPPGGSYQPRDQNHISMSPALAGGFFTTSATWEAGYKLNSP